MNTQQNSDTFVPWYRVGFFWVAMAPLFAAIFGTLVFLIPLALNDRDGNVAEDVYRSYRGYDVRQDDDIRARDMGLSAQLSVRNESWQINVQGLTSDWPQQLHLELIFPTREALDSLVVLTHRGEGLYQSGPLPDMSGRRYAHLKPVGTELMWRLRGEIQLPIEAAIELFPRVY